MKTVNPPIPVRTMDWAAYFDAEGTTGEGATELEAVLDLWANMDYKSTVEDEAAIWGKVMEIQGHNNLRRDVPHSLR